MWWREINTRVRTEEEGRTEDEVELHLTNEGVVEYEDWGGRGFDQETEDCGLSRGAARPEGELC